MALLQFDPMSQTGLPVPQTGGACALLLVADAAHGELVRIVLRFPGPSLANNRWITVFRAHVSVDKCRLSLTVLVGMASEGRQTCSLLRAVF